MLRMRHNKPICLSFCLYGHVAVLILVLVLALFGGVNCFRHLQSATVTVALLHVASEFAPLVAWYCRLDLADWLAAPDPAPRPRR
ncbi:hypothetical protein V8F06_007179 [Rhypophila decipiens]